MKILFSRSNAGRKFHVLLCLLILAVASFQFIDCEAHGLREGDLLHDDGRLSSITSQSVVDDCAYTFFPDATWAANHPGCVPDVQWVGNCVPTCTLSDCVPGDGDVEIGTIKLTFDGTVYRVYIIDGGVITVLVEDF